ncbi:hypothetical protein F4677DRAFT_448092 [Hypoxylon crocopeplum]|nr:hypothetical protein F4677DRAFT_448092 [Hypoxylon crocopeplum]
MSSTVPLSVIVGTTVSIVVFTELFKVVLQFLLAIITNIIRTFFGDFSGLLSPILTHILEISDLLLQCMIHITELLVLLSSFVLPWAVTYFLFKSLLWDRGFFTRLYALGGPSREESEALRAAVRPQPTY